MLQKKERRTASSATSVGRSPIISEVPLNLWSSIDACSHAGTQNWPQRAPHRYVLEGPARPVLSLSRDPAPSAIANRSKSDDPIFDVALASPSTMLRDSISRPKEK